MGKGKKKTQKRKGKPKLPLCEQESRAQATQGRTDHRIVAWGRRDIKDNLSFSL